MEDKILEEKKSSGIESFEELVMKAEANDSKALLKLGKICLFSEEHRSDQESYNYFKRAASLNEGEAYAYLSVFYLRSEAAFSEGKEKARNPASAWKSALACLEKGVQLHDPKCMIFLGYLYLQGRGVEKDRSKGEELLKQAASHNALGMRVLADYYHKDKTRKHEEEARDLIKRAAETGDPLAMERTGDLYSLHYLINKKDKRALEWYEKAADNGQNEAAVKLAELYYKNRSKEVFNWEKRVSEINDTKGKILYGKCCLTGCGVNKNENRGFLFLKMAAKRQDEEAMNLLGECYYYGKGTDQSFDSAVKWFKKSAEKNNIDAMEHLRNCYTKGEGVPKDLNIAKMWENRINEILSGPAETDR